MTALGERRAPHAAESATALASSGFKLQPRLRSCPDLAFRAR
jgi:hypothetical protein